MSEEILEACHVARAVPARAASPEANIQHHHHDEANDGREGGQASVAAAEGKVEDLEITDSDFDLHLLNRPHFSCILSD